MFSGAFVLAANHLLERASWARERLAPHAERRARLRLGPATVDFAVEPSGHLCIAEAGEPDVVLTLAPARIPDLALGRADDTLRDLHIEGNADLADALGFVFRHLRWDAEEDLSRLIGDIAAHRAMTAGRALVEATRRACRNAGDNLAEYLAEDNHFLPTRADALTHTRRVQALRDELAALEHRVARLAPPRGAAATSGRR